MLKRLCLIIACCSMLQGCVALVAGGAGAGLVYERRSLETVGQDAGIEHQADVKLAANRKIRDNTHIVVASYDHMVLVAGEAPTQELKTTAIKIVESVPGIHKLYDQIEIAAPSSALTRSSDAWITTKIKTMMMATKDLKSGDIKVVTENGSVFLMGYVSHHQANMAVDVARRATGVQRVVKLFEYTEPSTKN